MKQKYSLIEIFGKLPVHPDVYATLDKRLKWLGECVEGEDKCVMCGTLEPRVPRSHHEECAYFSHLDEFPLIKSSIGVCPDCESEDSLIIDSSREMRVSIIKCIDCDFEFTRKVDEETLIEVFKKKYLGGVNANRSIGSNNGVREDHWDD